MKKLIIGGVIFTVALLGIIYSSISGSILSDGGAVNIYSAVAAVAIIVIAVGVVLKYVNQMQNDTATGEETGHDWDGIKEFKNKIPTGWAVGYIGLIIWAAWYMLIGYPVGSYSQLGEYNEEVAAYNESFNKKWYTKDAKGNILADNKKQLIKMGKSVFLVNCAPCHGGGGDGQGTAGRDTLKAEDLTQRKFSKSYVKHVMTHGSNQLGFGYMPDRNGLTHNVKGTPISDKNIDVIANYVSNGFKGKGVETFEAYCALCHAGRKNQYTGVKTVLGDGIKDMGPSLKRYNKCLVNKLLLGGSKQGEIGFMPSFAGRLNEVQRKSVAVYIEAGLPEDVEE